MGLRSGHPRVDAPISAPSRDMSVPFDPIRPKERLFQEIVEHVQAQILSGELKPGDRIPADALLLDPHDVPAIAAAMARMLAQDDEPAARAERGPARARDGARTAE